MGCVEFESKHSAATGLGGTLATRVQQSSVLAYTHGYTHEVAYRRASGFVQSRGGFRSVRV